VEKLGVNNSLSQRARPCHRIRI